MPLIVSHRNEVYHMKQFQWEQLVSSKRIPPNQPKNDLSLLRSEVESDYYRIINSASYLVNAEKKRC